MECVGFFRNMAEVPGLRGAAECRVGPSPHKNFHSRVQQEDITTEERQDVSSTQKEKKKETNFTMSIAKLIHGGDERRTDGRQCVRVTEGPGTRL